MTEAEHGWARVNALFHRALERPTLERRSFVREEAGDDEVVIAEVTSLLAAHERAGTFIEQPIAAAATVDALARAASVAGRRIGQYRLLRVLGEGGMGIVYLAEDTRLGRTVALKALAPECTAHPVRRARMAREARAAAALAHPGIATVFALEDIDGQLFIASEYVPGRTLREELADGPFGARRACETMAALAQALAVAHARGIVHRDLKPENVVRAADGPLKILDFGIATFVDGEGAGASLTGEGALLGTPGYMAPEQIRGTPTDARTDIFALGVLTFELATGVHPFQADSPAAILARVLEHDPDGFPAANGVDRVDGVDEDDAFSRGFESLVLSCLRKTVEERVQSASDLATALAGLDDAGDTTPSRLQFVRPDLREQRTAARWWWRFHQSMAIVAHVLLLWPLWGARDLTLSDRGMWLFLIGVAGVSVGGALRMHLLFASRHYPRHWPQQRRRFGAWVHVADIGFASVLLAAGIQAMRAEAPAVLLVAAAASVAVASLVIEPAATHAAWDDD